MVPGERVSGSPIEPVKPQDKFMRPWNLGSWLLHPCSEQLR